MISISTIEIVYKEGDFHIFEDLFLFLNLELFSQSGRKYQEKENKKKSE